MIKGLILDVDGVIVGNKENYNWPMPNREVISTLDSLRKKGMPVCLCTAKGTFAIKDIVLKANLDNLHIGDGGALVIDFINDQILEEHFLDRDLAIQLIELLLKNNIYVEVYTLGDYFVEKSQASEITGKHTAILNRPPVLVKSLVDESRNNQIIKVMPVANNEKQKETIIRLLKVYEDRVSLQWGVHLTALPHIFGAITPHNISKKRAAYTISRNTGIPLEDFLGVGDSMTDWNFMEICGYGGVMGNGSEDLKKKISEKNDKGYIGKSVNENGLLDILKHFKII